MAFKSKAIDDDRTTIPAAIKMPMVGEAAGILPVPGTLVERGRKLVHGVTVDLDNPLPDNEA